MPADRSQPALSVALLGPLALRVDGGDVAVPGARRRALLAALALGSGRVIGADRLVDILWPEEPPENAAQALYNHVSRLRSHLGARAERLERHGGGYRLRLEPDELDVDVARRLASEAVEPDADPAAVADLARSALALWRGPALDEFRGLSALEVESVALDELRLRLLDDLLEARLALGDRSVTEDAASAAASDPLRERTALLHVRALAVEGRTAEAMAAAQAFRRRLADETGLDPGPALRDLEQMVAAGSLGSSDRTTPHLRRRIPVAPDGPLVGRQHDRSEVLRLLAHNAVVTVAGPGGVGKTRLALDLAADPDAAPDVDVVVVDLAAVDLPERVCQAMVSTLGLLVSGDVQPEDVADALADRRLLLVLDNCEHVPQACRDLVVAVRRRAPGVRVLATSRLSLNVPGEYVVRLQPLPVPRDASDLVVLRRQPGVRAFVEHARRVRAGFDLEDSDAADLVEVLRRLDGLPLGIELAARQVALMPLRSVRDRLDRALDLGTGRGGSGDDRQRTLRATIDSSYRLLTRDEQRLLRALAPFPGGVDLATLEGLATGLALPGEPVDLLHRLVDGSLLSAEPASGRYRLLFTVRSFLLDELDREGELADAEARFMERCLAVAEDIGVRILGPDEKEMDRRLRAELDNLRAARDVAASLGRDDVRVGLTLALGEGGIWRDLRELWSWALELAGDDRLVGHPDRPAVLGTAAEAARMIGDLDRAEALVDESVRIAGPDPDPVQVHAAWSARGSVAHFRGDFTKAREYWLRSGEGRTVMSGAWIGSAALATAYGGDPVGARELLDRAHAALARIGCRSHLAFLAYVQGELLVSTDPEAALPYYVEAVEAAREVGSTFVEGVASVGLASARTRLGDVAGAAGGFGYLLDFWRRTGQLTQLWTTARNAAGLLAEAGREHAAALIVLVAETQPGAAAVSPAIARHGGRAFVPLEAIIADDRLAELRAEAAGLGADAVLDLAREELSELSGG
jgi:predicted ATPase/DNA-binding SARP family transcriptional activator